MSMFISILGFVLSISIKAALTDDLEVQITVVWAENLHPGLLKDKMMLNLDVIRLQSASLGKKQAETEWK